MSLLNTALEFAKRVDVIKGRLVLEVEENRREKADWWSLENEQKIIAEIASVLGISTFRYTGDYDTGNYKTGIGSKTQPSVRLTFTDQTTGQEVPMFFNVDLTYARNTQSHRKGDALPKRQFRVSKNGAFVKFWQRTVGELDRLSRPYKYLGNLKAIALVGELKQTTQGQKLINDSVSPLNVSHQEIVRLTGYGHNSVTTRSQVGHNVDTMNGHKEIAETLSPPWLEEDSCTSLSDYVLSNKYNGYKGSFNNTYTSNVSRPPHDQTLDEWLQEYDSAP